MMNKKRIMLHTSLMLLAGVYLGCSLHACKRGEQKEEKASTIDPLTESELPNSTLFNADSAYRYIEQQVAFGPRVPNTDGHRLCAEWIERQMRSLGAEVQLQRFEAKAHTGEVLKLTNVIASYNPGAERRILLMAHWDTRPWADEDPVVANRTTPILGADDAGSGVAILMEMGRYFSQNPPSFGVDMLFFDGEDYGQSNNEESWCLGSTHWSKNPHRAGYKAEYGILFDMVGSEKAKFRWEGYSKSYAPQVVAMVWDQASRLGYGNYFIQGDGGYLTDDHVPVIKNLKIPCIDIVNYDPNSEKGFGAYWHTVADDMKHISAKTLQAVGHTTLTAILENESKK